MASGSSASNAQGNPVQSGMGKWTRYAIALGRSLLNLGKNNDNSQSALSTMPMDDYDQIFKVVSGHVVRSAERGVFKWKHSSIAADVLARGNPVLEDYVMDMFPRSAFALSDSTVVTKTGNKNSAESGILFEKVFNLRKDCWKNRSQEIYVFAVCAGRQADFLKMLADLVKNYCAGGDPSAFRGNLLLFISLNDVKLGKQYAPDWKLDDSRKVVAILRKIPLGTVSIIGPGSEENWRYKAGTFKPIADQYMAVLLESGHPIYNPEHVYGGMEMNDTFSTDKATGIRILARHPFC